MKTLILGGIKSGKSRLAETLATDSALAVTVIATATADDDEMRLRIAKHRSSRPALWHVIEEPFAVGSELDALNQGGTCVVLDCLTLWLSNLLSAGDERRFEHERSSLLAAVNQFQGRLILVSNETSMGIVPMGELTRRYCDEAGLLHQKLATLCDEVVLVVAGLPQVLKAGASLHDKDH